MKNSKIFNKSKASSEFVIFSISLELKDNNQLLHYNVEICQPLLAIMMIGLFQEIAVKHAKPG